MPCLVRLNSYIVAAMVQCIGDKLRSSIADVQSRSYVIESPHSFPYEAVSALVAHLDLEDQAALISAADSKLPYADGRAGLRWRWCEEEGASQVVRASNYHGGARRGTGTSDTK